MLPFDVSIAPGDSPYRQVVYAATKAILGGVLVPGDAFPSVRELSQALKINPNTAQKVVAELVRDGLLVVQPGVGTLVARAPKGHADERRRLLAAGVEALLVEARRLGVDVADLHDAVDAQWGRLFGDEGARPVPQARSGTSAARRRA
ncbi:MAG: GntR family transcriptional regulator [Gemmatimonadaceae bacterium]|nr:GntR family transcriptional regulator [Gemmatimonadaceae bacterium]